MPPPPPPTPCPPLAVGVRGADIMPLVQEALDSIEFVTGPPDRCGWLQWAAGMGIVEGEQGEQRGAQWRVCAQRSR